MANSLIRSSFGMFTAFATFPLKRINEELHQENNSLKQELKKISDSKKQQQQYILSVVVKTLEIILFILLVSVRLSTFLQLSPLSE